MNCLGLRRLETDYIDDLLGPAARREVAAHLHVCGPCADRVNGIRSVVGALARLPQEPPPAELYARIVVAAAEPPTPVERLRLGWSSFTDLALGWSHPALTRAVAGALVVLFAVVAGFARSTPALAPATTTVSERVDPEQLGDLAARAPGVSEHALVTVVSPVGEAGEPRAPTSPEPVTMFIYASLDVRG